MARILIVEDNPDNMKLFRALLAMKGHVVSGLWSGDGLLEELSANPPDLVLMDIQLPGRDGFELLTEIRRSPFSQLKVVALTAHAMSGDREKAENAGFDEYITKPIDIGSFADLVARTLATDPNEHGGG